MTAVRDQSGTEGGEFFDTVHAKILHGFPRLVAELGGDVDALMRQAGIAPDGSPSATYRQMTDLIELSAIALNLPDFGMRLARIQNGDGVFGPLGEAMRNSRTFGDALEYAVQHAYAHSLASRIWLKPLPEEQAVFAGHDILLDRMPHKCQAMELILLAGHFSAMAITGGQARVRRVHFRHEPVSPLKTYRAYFGCEVRFGQNEDGVVFFERDLASPIVSPDAKALAAITSFIDAEFTRRKPPLHAEARGIILHQLGSGPCTNENVAAELKMHPRKFHRRLAAEGTSFQRIKDSIRLDLMLYYLRETQLDFSQISERLGFAEQSVMTRRCNQWLGASPTQIRIDARRVPAQVQPLPAVSQSVKPEHL